MPKSSGKTKIACEKRPRRRAVREASKHRAAKWIRLFPTSALARFTALSHGNPSGYSLERSGRGPLWFAHTARVHVLHGGVMTWN